MSNIDTSLKARWKERYDELMSRDSCQINGFSAIQLTKAKAIMAAERFDAMMKDKTQCQGPTADTVYPWNVAMFTAMNDREFTNYLEAKAA